MPRWTIYTIRTGLVLVVILFVIACVWRWEINRDPQIMTVKKAFADIEDYPGWTPEELERIKERKKVLVDTEKLLGKIDQSLEAYKVLKIEYEEFIEEYGE